MSLYSTEVSSGLMSTNAKVDDRNEILEKHNLVLDKSYDII